MAACSEFEMLLTSRAVGDLPDAESERLDQHLVQCASCKADAEATEEALQLARMPAPSAGELAALATLPQTTRAALRKTEQRGAWWRGAAVGLSAAAALWLIFGPRTFVSIQPGSVLEPTAQSLAQQTSTHEADSDPDPDTDSLAEAWMNGDSELEENPDVLSLADTDANDADLDADFDADLDIGAAD